MHGMFLHQTGRLWVAVLIIIAADSAQAQSPAPGDKGATTRPAMFVSMPAAGQVAIFTTDPPMAAGIVPVGPEARCLAASADGRWLTIAHRDSVSILDTHAMDTLVDLKACPRASGMAFHPDSRSLWVADAEGRRLLAYRLHTDWQPDAPIQLDECPELVSFNHDGATAFVTSRAGVHLIDVARRRSRAVARTRRQSGHLELSPDGQRLYVLNTTLDNIFIVDTADGSIAGDLLLPDRSSAMALSPDGTRLYAAFFSLRRWPEPGKSSIAGSSVAAYNAKTHEHIATVPDLGSRAGFVACNDAGTRLFATGGGDGRESTVTVIDAATHKPTQTLQAFDVYAVHRWPGTGYVIGISPRDVFFIAGEPARIEARLPVGLPASICFGGVGNLAGRLLTAPPATQPAAARQPRMPERKPVPPLTVAPEVIGGYNPAARSARGEMFPSHVQIAQTLTDQERQRLAPSRVSLRLQNAAAQGAFAALAQQTGYVFQPGDANLWQVHRQPVTIEAVDQPLWPVLYELGRQSGVHTYLPDAVQGRFCLLPTQILPGRVPVASGPFLLSATEVRQPYRGRLEVFIWSMPEPKLWVAGGARYPTIAEAVDEAGTQLPALLPRGSPGMMPGTGFNVVLTRPQDAGQRLARLAGVGHLFVVLQSDEASMPDLLAAKPAELKAGGLRFHVSVGREAAVGRGFSEWLVATLRLPRGGRAQADWSQALALVAASRFRIVDARGASLSVEREFDQERAGDYSLILRAPAPESDNGLGSTPPLKLLVQVPTRLAEVDVPFEFRDLPLPPQPAPAPTR